jgi:hypothetical protein
MVALAPTSINERCGRPVDKFDGDPITAHEEFIQIHATGNVLNLEKDLFFPDALKLALGFANHVGMIKLNRAVDKIPEKIGLLIFFPNIDLSLFSPWRAKKKGDSSLT